MFPFENRKIIISSVTGENLRYTTKDMDVIRKEAKISADDSREELERMKVVCKMYEQLFIDLETLHKKKLLQKVSFKFTLYLRITDNQNLNYYLVCKKYCHLFSIIFDLRELISWLILFCWPNFFYLSLLLLKIIFFVEKQSFEKFSLGFSNKKSIF